MLTLALLQTELHWENPGANRDFFAQKLSGLPQSVDLAVLPEMFTTGFSMSPDRLAERMDGPTMVWMAEQASRTNAVLVGTLMVEENGRYYNRLIWMRPNGTYDHYDKRHLFGMAGEDRVYTAGRRQLHVELKGWRVCPLICYDLRFPVWCRNTEDYDLLLFTANWPERRIAHWNALLRARAIENQCFVAAVNRVGQDGNQIRYSGDSALIGPTGETIEHLGEGLPGTIVSTIRLSELSETRLKLPFLADRDDFRIQL
jgi:omega-amidase